MKTIKELRAAHAATTQGEWDFVIADNAEVPRSIVVDYNGEDIVSYASTELIDQNNAEFIALAHNEWPGLIDEIEQQRQKLYQWDSVFAHLGDTPDAIGNLIRDEYDKRDNEIEQLKDEVSTLTNAARAVRDNWESGDLAGAVSWLSGLLED